MPNSTAATYSSAASPAMNGTELTAAAAGQAGGASTTASAAAGGQKTGDALGQALASVSIRKHDVIYGRDAVVAH